MIYESKIEKKSRKITIPKYIRRKLNRKYISLYYQYKTERSRGYTHWYSFRYISNSRLRKKKPNWKLKQKYGKIILPERLLDYLGYPEKIVWIDYTGGKFELWNPLCWDVYYNTVSKSLDNDPEIQ